MRTDATESGRKSFVGIHRAGVVSCVEPSGDSLGTTLSHGVPRWLVPNSRNGDFAITKPQVSDLQIVANRHLTPAT